MSSCPVCGLEFINIGKNKKSCPRCGASGSKQEVIRCSNCGSGDLLAKGMCRSCYYTKWFKTPEGKETLGRAVTKYQQTDKGKEAQKRANKNRRGNPDYDGKLDEKFNKILEEQEKKIEELKKV
jgi:hypothetical protein